MFCLPRKAPHGLQGALLGLKFPFPSLLQSIFLNYCGEELVLLCRDRATAAPRRRDTVVLHNFIIANSQDFTAR